MDTKNSKGQAFLEMAFSLLIFAFLWGMVQLSIKNHKGKFHKWELGNETQVRFQKNDSRRKN